MDLYTILGLTHAATLAEIKRAYRRLARRYHPDINPGDGHAVVRFRQITEAYETLSDPARRQRYDLSGGNSVEEVTIPSYGFEGFDFSVTVSGAQAPTFGDLFAEVFGQGGTAPVSGPTRGADLHTSVAFTFEEALRGAERRIALTRHEICHSCGGSGALRTAESRCSQCHGAGTLRSTRGHMVFSKSCPQCGGTGRQQQLTCPSCRGEGVEAKVESIFVHIPAGVADGARVRVAGKGHAGRRGAPPGDLQIAVQVAPHAIFRREDDDLHLVVPIAIHEAALGAKIEVPSLEGPVRVRVPPGTQTGQRFRVRERGVTSPRTGRRGDLVVEVRLTLPKMLDERSKELLREFGRVNTEDVRADLTKAGAGE
ncbi:MAG TPA: J domain-containing protein [Vicinamibacterales bacterium]|jgi:molecular chaperone DnaJ